MKKTFILVLALMMGLPFCTTSAAEDSIQTALLIIDIQEFYFPGEGPGLTGAEEASVQAGRALHLFRSRNQLVVHVRHQSNKGFAIHQNVLPLENEKVITKTRINSFTDTDLLEYLKERNIRRLIITGMQTQMCVEAAVRAASDYGFEVIVIDDACATRDVVYDSVTVKAADVHASTLATFIDGGYARVILLRELLDNPHKYLFGKLE